MSDKPFFTVPHWVELGGEDFRLYRYVSPDFMKLMGALFPKFASYTKAENGFSAFTSGGVFIGSFAGMTLQSVRRNPVYPDGGQQLFLRALLGGLYVDGYKHHNSVCSPENYGTLRLWQKMGLGSKLDRAGKARSALGTPETKQHLADLIADAKPGYEEVRRYAERQMGTIGVARFLPTEASLQAQGLTPVKVSVSLSVD